MTVKTAEDLMDDPILPPSGGGMGFGDAETGYDKALGVLTETDDEPLELMTRTNPIMAKACALGYNMMFTFRSAYVCGRVNQNMRLAVSNGGRGREEIVRSLGASGEAFSGPDLAQPSGRIYQPAPDE